MKKKAKPKTPRLRIGVVPDFDEKLGYFIKSDLAQRLESLNVDVETLFYEKAYLNRLSELDGLLIPGGLLDLDPALYGEKKEYPEVQILKNRADFEFRVFEKWLKTEKPLLSICWGFQSLNVFLGGSLYQHIPAQMKSDIAHEQSTPAHEPSHGVGLLQKASQVFNSKNLKVNSTHHQGIKKLGKDLIDQGRAEDTLIECAYLKNHPFAWAVQWHPERLANDPVIPAFLKATRK